MTRDTEDVVGRLCKLHEKMLLAVERNKPYSPMIACGNSDLDTVLDAAVALERAKADRQSLSDRIDGLEGLAGDVRWQELAEGAPFTVIDRMMLRDMYAAARAALHQEGIAP